MSDLSCPHCGREFPDAESLERHVAGHERRHADDPAPAAASSEPTIADIDFAAASPTWFDRVFHGAGVIWRGFWTVVWVGFGIVVVVAVVIALFSGSDNSNNINVPPNAPGHAMLSSLKANGKIDNFQAVKPDNGWDYQYEINGDSGFTVQFRGKSMLVSYSQVDQDTANSITAAARDQGYGTGAAP